MRYPEFLKPGGRVGFIAPSFGCTTEPYAERFSSAIKGFNAAGYKTVIGPNCLREDGIGKSSTPENCAAEINEFFITDNCDIVLSCGGGETMCEDLPYVDFSKIAKSRPKWFMGYSDNTNLTFTLPTLADTAAIYGPCAADLGRVPVHPAIQDALDILTGRKLEVSNYTGFEAERPGDTEPLAPYFITEKFEMKLFGCEEEKADFSGRLLGGCLDCLVALKGTPFDRVRAFQEKYKDDGIIWFLEACDLNVMSIRRALWQLEQAGWFDTAKGFLIGRPLMYNDSMMGLDRINAVTDMLGKYNVPVLMDLDIGHLPPMMPIISGACADVHAADGKISIKYKLV